jgi:hypothetical protein
MDLGGLLEIGFSCISRRMIGRFSFDDSVNFAAASSSLGSGFFSA